MATKADITGEISSRKLTKHSYKKVRKHIKDTCGDMAELAVGEVLANALEHGTSAQLCIYMKRRRIEVTVTNCILPRSRKKSKPPGVGGRGLGIVQHLAATGAIHRYDCTIQASQHTTRLVLDRYFPVQPEVWAPPFHGNALNN